jgi:hypothetical protein
VRSGRDRLRFGGVVSRHQPQRGKRHVQERSSRPLCRTRLFAALGLLWSVGAAAAPDRVAVAKPGFPAGTWVGTGVISSPDETVAGHTTRFSGKFSFTLKVSRGSVSGTGKWTYRQIGTGGDIESKLVGVAPITFAGTPTKPTFSGTLTVNAEFIGYGKIKTGNTFTKPLTGWLLIKKAGSCRVTGGHTNGTTTVSWKAVLKGSGTCLV